QHRLHRSEDFRSVIRNGKRAGGRYVVLHVFHESIRGPRVGFVVSKAVGNAVARIRVKRRMRHATWVMLPGFIGSPDVVVRALPRSSGAGYSALQGDIRRGLRKMGVL